ncbi:hypothetical protein B0H14DRAFT_2960553 [Mycena olivaceomarginata]|nr:hypothetical protein B0H14DRAFT_2960553 [Mycena olivaceomarginata]
MSLTATSLATLNLFETVASTVPATCRVLPAGHFSALFRSWSVGHGVELGEKSARDPSQARKPQRWNRPFNSLLLLTHRVQFSARMQPSRIACR